MSRRIVILPSHWDGDGFYRLVFPARELSAHGWVAEVAPHVMTQTGRRSLAHYGIFKQEQGSLSLAKPIPEWLLDRQFDLLVMGQREEAFWPEVITALQAQGKTVIVDSDDSWLGLPDWNPGSRKADGAVEAMLAQIAAADALTVATPALADLYRPYQPNVHVIRNRLDWRMWHDVQLGGWRRPRIGWMGQVNWRAGDLGVIRNVVTPWLLRNPDWDFVAAGDPRTHDALAIPQDRRVTTNEVQFRTRDLADITAVMDVGLVPLKLNEPKARALNEGKSHLKGMEYAACGIPCIASPTESYRWWLQHEAHGTGFLAEKPKDWFAALDALRDEMLRKQMGAEALEAASRSTVQEHYREWERVYDRVCADRDDARPRIAA